jgi:hypothetical protein
LPPLELAVSVGLLAQPMAKSWDRKQPLPMERHDRPIGLSDPGGFGEGSAFDRTGIALRDFLEDLLTLTF